MDDQSNIQQTSEPVGFPSHSPAPAKRGIGKWVVFIVLLLVILGGGVFFLLRSSNEAIEAPTATPNIRGVETIYTPSPDATTEATATPEPFDKTDAKIQVLNGTGTAGDAGLAKTALTGIGYTQVDTGNASTQSATSTIVTVDSSVPESARNEIKTTLEKTFQTVTVNAGTVSGGYTIQITTGTKKGSGGSTSANSTPRASASPRPTATP